MGLNHLGGRSNVRRRGGGKPGNSEGEPSPPPGWRGSGLSNPSSSRERPPARSEHRWSPWGMLPSPALRGSGLIHRSSLEQRGGTGQPHRVCGDSMTSGAAGQAQLQPVRRFDSELGDKIRQRCGQKPVVGERARLDNLYPHRVRIRKLGSFLQPKQKDSDSMALGWPGENDIKLFSSAARIW
jgi:hypothetical protein